MKFLLASIWFCAIVVSEAQTVRPYAPELFPENLSGAVCGFSRDGTKIYFVREQPVTGNIWIYEAQ